MEAKMALKSLVISLLVVSINAFAAKPTTLIKYTQSGGFVGGGFAKSVVINSDGKVLSMVTQNGKTKTTLLAQLTDVTMKDLVGVISDVNTSSKLVDSNPRAPRCMDAPTRSTSVLKGSKYFEIAQIAFCHNFALEDGSAGNLPEIMEAYASLSN
jgi:hypothetical protein